jgi:hypothetical protein
MPTILVSNATELQNVNLDLAGVYQQTAAIDLTDVTFTPIGTGTGALRFAGSFDGAGFAITNLTIDTPLVDYVGLFGSTVGATIENVGVVGGSFAGKNYVAPLVGYNSTSATITGCYATGAATAGTSYAGGWSATTHPRRSPAATRPARQTAGTSYAGGLAGYNTASATITGCYATGAATATSYAGGLVGVNTISATIHRLLRDRCGNRNELRRRDGRIQHIRDDHRLLRDRRGNRGDVLRRRDGRLQHRIRDDHRKFCVWAGKCWNVLCK